MFFAKIKKSEVKMKKDHIKNVSGLKVYINGVPDIRNIPEDILDSFVKSLSSRVYILYEKKMGKTSEKNVISKK